MEFEQTDIPGVIDFQAHRFLAMRGVFLWKPFVRICLPERASAGPFVQDNHSGSQQGILRGLHYQIRQAQGKLVRTVAGEIFDVAVDLRRSSPTFGRWVGTRFLRKQKTIMDPARVCAWFLCVERMGRGGLQNHGLLCPRVGTLPAVE